MKLREVAGAVFVIGSFAVVRAIDLALVLLARRSDKARDILREWGRL